MLIVVNANARGGRGQGRWPKVRAALEAEGVAFEACETQSAGEAQERVLEAWAQGERRFVAAGGDGTVNALASLLVERGAGAELGAIGLGSSNDFHKPVERGHTLAGCPLRLGPAQPVDVGVARFVDTQGQVQVGHFLINASLGATATANGRFNQAGSGLRALKRVHVELAILACAGQALFGLRALPLRLTRDGGSSALLPTTNLAVLKRVHVAGGMRYDTPVALDDGLLAVNWIGDVGRWQLVRTIVNLYRGRFAGARGTASWLARTLTVESPTPTWLELDGEVLRARRVEFSVRSAGVRLCTPGWG